MLLLSTFEMTCYVFCVVCMHPAAEGSRQNARQIYIAGLFPVTSLKGDMNAAGVLPSVQLALQHVNEDRHILPRHILELDYNDTKVSL